MKIYLTENGLLVLREDASFFTSNSGRFRRLATQDEVEYLVKERKLFQMTSSLEAKFETIDLPLWHYLWSVRSSDYSGYKPETCNDGGDYAFHENEHFFARCIDNVWEIKSLTLYSTSAEFSYNELNGKFSNSMGYLNLLGVEGDVWQIHTQTTNGGEEEIVIDSLLEGNYTLDEVTNAQDYIIPEADSDDKIGFITLTEEEIQRRKEIAEKLGLSAPPKRKSSGRRKRS